jgi:hypothetical protein
VFFVFFVVPMTLPGRGTVNKTGQQRIQNPHHSSRRNTNRAARTKIPRHEDAYSEKFNFRRLRSAFHRLLFAAVCGHLRAFAAQNFFEDRSA